MQVSSISNQVFSGKRDNIDGFIQLEDSQIRRFALEHAASKNEKSSKRLNKLYYSVPLVAGVAAAALTKGKTPFYVNELSGKAAKLANGLRNGGYWAFLMGTAAVGSAISNKLEDKSEKYHNFRQNHPGLSLVGDIAAFLAITSVIPKAGRALLGKLGPKSTAAISKGINKVADGVNKLKMPKFLKTAGQKIAKVVPQKVKSWAQKIVIPKSVKTIGKTAVAYAPHIALLSAFFGTLNNRSKIMRDANNTYSQIKSSQQNILKARLAELQANQ